MKIIVEYTIMNGQMLTRGTVGRGVKVLGERASKPDHPADFPRQRIEYFVEDGSDAGRAICALLGLTVP